MADEIYENTFKKFDPQLHKGDVLKVFNEFVAGFEYSYEAIAKEPPTSANTEVLKNAWTSQNKRKTFLGKFSTRNLQQEYEEATTAQERIAMDFDGMLTKFRERFNLSSNHQHHTSKL